MWSRLTGELYEFLLTGYIYLYIVAAAGMGDAMASVALTTHADREAAPARSSTITLVALAAAAYSAADVVHEVIGHVGMCLLTGTKFSIISTIGVTTGSSSRAVAAAGMLVEIAAGALALLAFRRRRKFDATSCFLWMFAAVALMDVGYLIYSGITGTADWGVVIRGLEPAAAWRIAMTVAGYLGYVAAMKLSARAIAPYLSHAELWRVTLTAYLTGGVLMTVAALFNPQGARYILISGVGGSFLGTIGLLRVPSMAARYSASAGDQQVVERSVAWIVGGVVCAALFIAVIGPGIRVP